MDRDVGQYIALITVSAAAIMLGMSYVAAYLIGKSHGRKEEQGSSRALEQADMTQRLSGVEMTVRSLDSSVERLMDAQRLLVAQQDHLTRKLGQTGSRGGVNSGGHAVKS